MTSLLVLFVNEVKSFVDSDFKLKFILSSFCQYDGGSFLVMTAVNVEFQYDVALNVSVTRWSGSSCTNKIEETPVRKMSGSKIVRMDA